MFKVSLILLLAFVCNGCVSSAINHSRISKSSMPTKSADKRLLRYAVTQGCTMAPSGYMVCPK